MAPEHFVGRRGHNHTADYWSMGIILFEMLGKTVPFPNNQSEQAVSRLIFPADSDNPSSVEFRDFVKRLLKFKPGERIGAEGGPEEILKHPWFAAIDQDAYYNRQIETDPEFIPTKFDWKKPSKYYKLDKKR